MATNKSCNCETKNVSTMDPAILMGFSFVYSLIAEIVTYNIIPRLETMFLKAHLFGIDFCKKDKKTIPEAMGVVSGCIFLITIFLFIPILFGSTILETEQFPHNELVELLAALLSMCCMLLLGFADDVLDLRWRHKLLLPTIASLPLLVVYYVNYNLTTVVIPVPFRDIFGTYVNIGILYYVFMGMLAVFCTNAINILAGVNGLEVGQSLIIGLSIVIFNFIEIWGEAAKAHLFSLYILLPYLATSLALIRHNWYPANVFVGDTFCYLSGMTFAVVGILGHFSKTLILFFLPQIFNFLFSVPQLFRLVPCPRHRMPRYLPEIDKLQTSICKISHNELNIIGRLIVYICKKLHLVSYEEKEDVIIISNLTLINLILVHFGPMHEEKLTIILLSIQILGSSIAFFIRYPLAMFMYNS